MKSEWNYVKLGEVVNFETGKLDSNQAEDEGIYPFFTCSPITLSINKIAFDTEAVLLAGNNANGIFPVKYYKGKFNAYQRTYIVTPKDRSYISTKWLYFRIKQLTKELRDLSVGSATKFLTKKILDNFEIKLPNIIIQNKTVNILWPLEDKIELNRKMNETLEAMAQAIFKSWFVDFDPVHAKARAKTKADLETEAKKLGIAPEVLELFPSEFEESELGMIPKGWEVDKLGNFVEILDSKRVPLSKNEREKRKGKIPYYGATSIMDYVDDYIFNEPLTLMGEDGSVVKPDGTPFVQYIWGKSWINNHAHVLKAKLSLSTEGIYIFLSLQNITQFVTGAVQPKINQTNLKKIPIINPTNSLYQMYSELINPIFEQIKKNTNEIQTLQQTRDALLPKLLSGKLDVLDL